MPHPGFSIPIFAALAFTALFRPERFLELVILLSVLPVASLFDLPLGDSVIAVPPSLFAAAMFCLLSLCLPNRRGSRIARPGALLLPFVLFTVFALASGVVFPTLFEGRFHVSLAMDRASVSPLAWGRMNVTQAVYLALLALFSLSVAFYVGRRPQAAARIARASIVAGFAAAAIAAYQFAAASLQWYYPFDVLYARPEVRELGPIVRDFRIGGLRLAQLYGSFSEPSTLAQYLLSALSGSLFWWARGGAPLAAKALAVASCATLLATASTTAYAGLACALAAAFLYLTWTRRRGMLAAAALAAALAAGAALFAILPELSGARAYAAGLFDYAILDKRTSGSWAVRTQVDSIALQAFLDSYGFGVGWGSTRASSLLVHLAANAGAIGLALLVWFGGALHRRLRALPGSGERTFLAAALCGFLLGGAIAVPDVTEVHLWALLGTLAGLALPAPVWKGQTVWTSPTPQC